jgi:hypothetical protein
MPVVNDFPNVFEKLKAILQPYEARLIVVHDTDTHYYLDTPYVMKNKHRLCFGIVRIGKGYVSFHLMPVYACPELVKSISPELRKRMQGKACFNFKVADENLFKELGKLTKLGFAKFNDVAALRSFRR